MDAPLFGASLRAGIGTTTLDTRTVRDQTRGACMAVRWLGNPCA